MKRIFVTSVVLASILSACGGGDKSSTGGTDYAIISGKVASVGATKELYLVQNDEVIRQIPVAGDGTFKDTIRNIENNHLYYLLSSFTSRVPLYLNTGANIEIAFDQDVNKSKITGEQAKESQYLLERNIFISNIDGADSNLFGQKPQEFKVNLKTYFDELQNKLKSYNLGEEFVKNQERWAKYKFVEYLLVYPTYHTFFMGRDAILPNDFFAEREGIDYDNAQEYDQVESYRDLVRSKYIEILTEKVGNGQQLEAFIDAVKGLKSANIRADLAKELLPYISPNNNKSKLLLDFINENVTNEQMKEQAKKAYDYAVKLSSGSESPKFLNYENFKGGTSSLDDFKGKVVYIDVWATWCPPCRQEIPFLQALENKLHAENIEFVSISIDDNNQKWKDFVAKEGLKGVQLIADKAFESQFITDYGITQIPTFIIIGKDGKIINADAPRPSDPSIESVLRELL